MVSVRKLRIALAEYSKAVTWEYNAAPFHNPIHAADVTLALYVLMRDKEPRIEPLVAIMCYCAALGHDVNHPGYSNWYAIFNGEGDDHDTHPLESMHARETIRLLEESGVAEFFGKEDLELIEKLILGTDMQVHNMWIEKAREYEECSLEDRLSILLHVADLCNPSRTRTAMVRWSAVILEEFGHERDLFFAAGKQPPSSIPPRADSTKTFLATQLGFFRRMIEPLYKSFGPCGLTTGFSENTRSRWQGLALYEAEELNRNDICVGEMGRLQASPRGGVVVAEGIAQEYISVLPPRSMFTSIRLDNSSRRHSAPM